MNPIELNYTVDLAKPDNQIKTLSQPLFYGDKQAHTINVAVTRNGEAENIEDMTCVGYIVFEETGQTLALPDTSSTSGNIASVTLDENAYLMTGRACVIVRLSNLAMTTTVLALYCWISTGVTDETYAPSASRLNYDEIVALIGDCEDATDAAQSALAQVSAVVSYTAQTPTAAQRAQARENIGAQSLEALETDTSSHYLRVEDEQTSVTMQNGAPELTSASNVYQCCVVSCTEGEIFTFTGKRQGTSSPGYVFLDDSGNILGQYNSSTELPETIVTAPAGSTMLYFLKTTNGNAENNAMWRGITQAAMMQYVDDQIASAMLAIALL